MSQPYDLTQLDSNSFEHLVNFLSLKILGNGVSGFAAGADAGRDGFLKGRAPYPTDTENWDGLWFIQSKFHKPHLSNDPQKWFVNEVKKEIDKFIHDPERQRPNNWIFASNIEPSGASKTGAYDTIIRLVKKFDENIKVDIWGGRKILDFLISNPEAARTYGHFLTPGHIITEMYDSLKKSNRRIDLIINHIVVNQFIEFSYTKLEQAGAIGDQRPKIYQLFHDLPISINNHEEIGFIMECLVSSSSNVQKNSMWHNYGESWREWSKQPMRSRVILLKGGPGQGKSTAGQYFGQIQRAAFILANNNTDISLQCTDIARELKMKAEEDGYWPTVPRIPLFIELKDFAKWYITKNEYEPRNIVGYLCEKIRAKTSQDISAEMMHEAFELTSWFVNFDGLDEVPNDVKDDVANEIIEFTNELIPRLDADFLVLCTTRPQGYSGQFENLNSSEVTLIPLPDDIALKCASAVVKFNRDGDEAESALAILKSAMASEQVKELMTTPLQSHIMAVVVRDGGRPPEKRWELFNNFYNVMKKRESMKNFPELKIQSLLREHDQLLKSIHDRLGICLHAQAEMSRGAEATLGRTDFKKLAKQTVEMQFDDNIDDMVSTLMEATTERLVFVNTPDNSESVRFDIRQLQEFFAAEFIYTAVTSEEFSSRFEIICGDAHWREVVHFLLSALVSHQKMSELVIAANILQSLDDDSESSERRMFKKCMGTGALLTLRLLNEGVLEQDKKIRNPFSKSILPIWNMLETEAFVGIFSVRKEQSKKWLLSLLLDAMTEMDYSEHVASGYLLSFLLDDKHPRINEVQERIRIAPDYYIQATFDLISKECFANRRQKNTIKNWFVDLIMEFIFTSKFNHSCAQRQAIIFILNHKEIILTKISIMKLTKDIEFLLRVMLNTTEDEKQNNSKNEVVSDYCFIKVKHYNKNWFVNFQSDIIPDHDFSDNDISSAALVLQSAVIFYKNITVESFKKLISSIIKNNYDFEIIPSYLRAMIPIDFEFDSFDSYLIMVQSLHTNEIEEILNTKNTNHPKKNINYASLFFDSRDFDKEKWEKLCTCYPKVAINIWANISSERDELLRAKQDHKDEFYEPLVKIALNDPNKFSSHFFHWKELFDEVPESEMQLRASFATIDEYYTSGFRSFVENPFEFKFDLPKENNYIICFAHSLLDFEHNFAPYRMSRVSINRQNYNETMLSSLGISIDYLIHLANDSNQNDLLRVSCIACFITLMSNDKNKIINTFFSEGFDKIMIDLFDEVTSHVIALSIHSFLNGLNVLDVRLIEFLGSFSIRTKKNYLVKFIIQSVYQDWRERSSAPVDNNKLLPSWMSYEFS